MFRCRSIAAAGDSPFLVSPKKPEEKKGDPGSCVGLLGSDANFAAVQSTAPSGEPQARRIWTLTPKTQPAVLGKSGVPLELGFASDKSRALIRFSLRSSAHPQGVESQIRGTASSLHGLAVTMYLIAACARSNWSIGLKHSEVRYFNAVSTRWRREWRADLAASQFELINPPVLQTKTDCVKVL